MSTWTVTVGNNENPYDNTTCKAKGSMIDSGWYMCPTALSGKVFGILQELNNNSNPVNFLEVMVYSQEAIQLQALETTLLGNAASNSTFKH